MIEDSVKYDTVIKEVMQHKNKSSESSKCSMYINEIKSYMKSESSPDENWHTNILEILFNDEVILSSFIKTIGDQQYADAKIESVESQHYFNDGIKDRYIDLLIKYTVENKTRAIIVENKINDADDTEEQLKSYFEYVKNTPGISDIRIVYLAASREKSPRLETLSHEALKHFYNYQAGCNPIMVFHDNAHTPNIKSLYHDCFQDAIKKMEPALSNESSYPEKQAVTILLQNYMSYLDSDFSKNNLFKTENEAAKTIKKLKDLLSGRENSSFLGMSKAFALYVEGKIFRKGKTPAISFFDYRIGKYVMAINLTLLPNKTIVMDLFTRRIRNEQTNKEKYHERMKLVTSEIGLSKDYSHAVLHDKYHNKTDDVQDGIYRLRYKVPSDVSDFYSDLEKVKRTLSDLSENYKVRWAQNAYSIRLFEE